MSLIFFVVAKTFRVLKYNSLSEILSPLILGKKEYSGQKEIYLSAFFLKSLIILQKTDSY